MISVDPCFYCEQYFECSISIESVCDACKPIHDRLMAEEFDS